MMTDYQRELLTAAADGELSDRQELALATLLKTSAEARTLLHELQAQARRLSRLPREAAPARLAASVQCAIQPNPVPVTLVGRVRALRYNPTVAWGVAASLLVAVTLSVYRLATSNSATGNDSPTLPVVLAQTDSPVPPPSPISASALQAETPEPATSPSDRMVAARTEPAAGSTDVAASPELAPLPRSSEPVLIGAAVGERRAPLNSVEARLPLFAPLVEFDRPDVLARLADELEREAAFRFDLFTNDTVKSVQELIAAGKQSGITIAVESAAHDRLKKKQPSVWVLYTEALTAEQLSEFVSQLATTVRNKSNDSPAEGHFYPARPSDQRELRDLFGVDLGLWKRPAPSKEPAPRSVTAGTLNELEQALRPGPDRKSPEEPAILLLAQPMFLRANPAQSRELRQYLNDRGERKPNTIPLIVVIRPLP